MAFVQVCVVILTLVLVCCDVKCSLHNCKLAWIFIVFAGVTSSWEKTRRQNCLRPVYDRIRNTFSDSVVLAKQFMDLFNNYKFLVVACN